VSARLAAAAALVVALTGCATTRQTPAAGGPRAPGANSSTASAGAAPKQLCALDTLRWSLGFVPRATTNECVTLLDTVRIGNE
jgi:hypothetical protein